MTSKHHFTVLYNFYTQCDALNHSDETFTYQNQQIRKANRVEEKFILT